MTDASEPERPLVSVVIPTYGRPDLVVEAVESVLAQTYSPIELVVVDDHSETPARAAIEELPLESLAAVRHVRHPTNRGASAARNTGIAVSNGGYVAFLDDDDQWSPTKIERQVDAMRAAADDVGLIYSGIRFESADASTEQIPPLSGDVTRDLLVGRSLCPTSTILVKRSALRAVGGFDEALPSWNDRDLYLRLAGECQFDGVPEVLTIRRAGHDHDQISENYEQKREETYPRFVSKHRPTAAEYGRQCERRFLASVSLMLAKSAMKNGYHADARRFFLLSIRWNPLDREPYVPLLAVVGGDYTYKPASVTRKALSRLARRFRRRSRT